MKKTKLKIIVDENIPLANELFGNLGQVQSLPGREMSNKAIADADILLVRSVTKVGPELLKNSKIGFVGTATIGMDHIDRDFLLMNNIGFASAAGSNSISVAEFVIAAILELATKKNLTLAGKTLAVIGHGNIGKKLAAMAPALGLEVWLNDPPLARQNPSMPYQKLEDVLKADFITFHTPLEKQGPWPSWHLLNETNMKLLKSDAVIINTARGDVVDNQALYKLLANGKNQAILDVWANEPAINCELLRFVAIGTPHIAGYSLDGKINGSFMLYQSLCHWLAIEPELKLADLLPASNHQQIIDSQQSGLAIFSQAMQAVYPLIQDDNALREILNLPSEQVGPYFDSLRKNYPVRREAETLKIKLQPENQILAQKLKLLGFNS